MSQIKATKKIFPISTFISDLPADTILQPLSSTPENGSASGRLVIVGDVHGMRKSLESLLDKVGFNKNNEDHLVLVGDLVSKGPDSPGVVDIAMKLGASAVRGNHENAVLNAAAEINAQKDQSPQTTEMTGDLGVPENADTMLPEDAFDKPEVPDKPTSGLSSQITASLLSTFHLDWLASLPLILRIKLPPTLSTSLGDSLIVVHAGLVPGVPLEEQDPSTIIHMRSFTRQSNDDDKLVPDEAFGNEGWIMEWDRWQDKSVSKTTVVFGHDAKRRLQRGRYAIGLDSACLYGNQLSALVISSASGKIEHQVVQVDCADVPVMPKVPVEKGDKTVAV
ncbi:hypothetical protein N7532_003089 [Penicillium argentinense]|uniref:Calcineurin-like phosphoesterase domain-containing protein n=1 Tax=Penicillium argentinense TaxID=1131581 RepID=A0A9W9FMD6_9EURO|nr:uncharacterized protein N7532_003089 [Penicillium argentinense]KAJ5102560.1 hypothetical protein N7532_003089 [Penicillium argentinense]